MRGRSLPRTAVVCAGVLLAGLLRAPAARPTTSYLVIVNAENPVEELSRDDVSRIFLKKTAHWPDGRAVAPLDLAPTVPVRGEFSREVLRKSVRAVQAYWKREIFSGRSSPPPELATEAEVVAAVRANPHAVGYVSDEASLFGVKIIDVLDAVPAPGN
ncbi:MAG TPA: phosphate ABC transporter substrate-binding protein [Vicinamibacteria bacterium]|nr:phosphate ABC transporter substrate-binding protein [Vicinamibacteria bacterium]